MSPANADVRRIVLTRTDRVGDLILSTPTIATIRRTFPRAHITMVPSTYNAVIVARSPDVDRVVLWSDTDRPEAFGARFRDVDLAIALAPRAIDHRIVAATRAPRRIGYTYARRYLARAMAHRWLTDVLVSQADPVLSERDPSRPVIHEVDQVLRLAERAGASEVVRDLRVVVTPQERALAASIPPAPIVVQIGKRWGERGSTPESLVALFQELRALGHPLVATYAADGAALAEHLRSAGVADLVLGDLHFGVWAAIFERAACVLTIDTGATHVASAMGRPTVVLFEHRYFTLNSREWSPYRVPNALLCKPADESPAALRASRAEIVAAVARML